MTFSLLMMSSSSLLADGARLHEKTPFNIPRQRADIALTEFAEQADVTLIFPYDKVREVSAQRLVGSYPIDEAVEILLRGTGLKAMVGDDGQLTITAGHPIGGSSTVYKKNKLSSAILSIMASMFGAGAQAQSDDAQQPSTIEEVSVTGIRASLQRAMDIKRDGSGVVDAISAEDIGKFPDTNVAESLQRITGVSIDRSGGEGQLITVRGFGPQFNTVLVNGRQMATENQGREFSFDTLASELVKGIAVHKTSTARMQSGGVGSTVNVTTARPFDFNGFKVAGSVKSLYDENSEESSPQISGLVSNTFADGKFGVLLAVSHQERSTRLNQGQTDGWLANVLDNVDPAEIDDSASRSGNTFIPQNFDTKVTFEERTRTGGSLVLQFAPTDDLEVTLDGIYSDFDIETDATSFGHWFTADNLENIVLDENGTAIDLFQEVGHATDFHAKKFDRLTKTSQYGINAQWAASDNLSLSFDASTSSAERAGNNGGENQLSLIGYLNRSRLQIHPGQILPHSSEFQSADPSINNADGVQAGVSDYLDPSNGRAHVMLRRGWATDDQVDQYHIDGVWDEGSSSGLTRASFGLLYSTQTKSNVRLTDEANGVHCTFCGYPEGVDIPDEFLSVFDAGSGFLGDVSGSENLTTQWLAHDGEQLFAYLENIAGISYDAVRRNNSYEVEEDILAGYLELEFAGELAGMPLTAHTGVRVESTDVAVEGTESPLERLDILDLTELQAVVGEAQPLSADSSYHSVLPNMDVKLDITDSLVARFAASRSLTRPTLDQLSPVTVINTTRQGGNLRSSSGNQELEPFASDNLDLSLEYYYGDSSYVSVGYFRKDVENFIISTTEDQTFTNSAGELVTDPSTGDVTGIAPGEDPQNAVDPNDSVATFTLTKPSNGESAQVDGLELAVQHSFGDTGFGVIANATLVDSDAELDVDDVTQTFALTGLSDSFNLVGFYEKGPFQARLAWNWRDEFLQSLVQTVSGEPTFVDDYQQWDMSASYDINDSVSIFFEGLNLTEEVLLKHGRYDNHFLLAEDSGRRFALGLRATF
ncbi:MULTISPECIES: TonB-dependent receptor [unclassified Microbulbifer]|uniref:TonB-dependent receptor n=1 Tax=unclassified Microbulbifer TaxID=2619833 RepID=UPI0027E5A4D0|nr:MULTISPECIES: TonB-dependent receptor [unclassified Microbulbifer]